MGIGRSLEIGRLELLDVMAGHFLTGARSG